MEAESEFCDILVTYRERESETNKYIDGLELGVGVSFKTSFPFALSAVILQCRGPPDTNARIMSLLRTLIEAEMRGGIEKRASIVVYLAALAPLAAGSGVLSELEENVGTRLVESGGLSGGISLPRVFFSGKEDEMLSYLLIHLYVHLLVLSEYDWERNFIIQTLNLAAETHGRQILGYRGFLRGRIASLVGFTQEPGLKLEALKMFQFLTENPEEGVSGVAEYGFRGMYEIISGSKQDSMSRLSRGEMVRRVINSFIAP